MTDEKEVTDGTQSRRRKPLELRIVVDTNLLYTGSESHLLTRDLAELIEASRHHHDVQISWHLPEIVRLERRYQMQLASTKLFPVVGKLEKLLGTGLGITTEILHDRVHAAIEKQVTALGLNTLRLEPSRVDWSRLITDSVERRPPFQVGDTEKGFRDAILMETFVQFLESSPRNPSNCLVAMVTGDKCLTNAIEARVVSPNLRLVQDLNDLQGLINVVVANVTEDYVNRIRPIAQAMFFEKDVASSLYYKLGLRNVLQAEFAEQLQSRPPSATIRRNGTWFIGSPRFDRKQNRRVHWTTTVRVEASAYRLEADQIQIGHLGSDLFSTSNLKRFIFSEGPRHGTSTTMAALGKGLTALGDQAIKLSPPSSTIVYNTPSHEERLVCTGETVFEIAWSATLTTTHKLTRPTIDGQKCVATTWENDPK